MTICLSDDLNGACTIDWWLLLLLVTVAQCPCFRVYVVQIHTELGSRFLEFLPESNRRPRDYQSRALTNWASFTSSRFKYLRYLNHRGQVFKTEVHVVHLYAHWHLKNYSSLQILRNSSREKGHWIEVVLMKRNTGSRLHRPSWLFFDWYCHLFSVCLLSLIFLAADS